MRSRAQEKIEETALSRLHKAVAAVYFAAHWSADRECDEKKLWENLRDAAGFSPGYSTEVLGPPRK